MISFLTGAVVEVNSSSLPTFDQPIPVVLVRSGCKANRISGTCQDPAYHDRTKTKQDTKERTSRDRIWLNSSSRHFIASLIH